MTSCAAKRKKEPGRRTGDKMSDMSVQLRLCVIAAFAAVVAGCATTPSPRVAGIEHIVVIYAENRSFDHLYGLFPGANGIANATPASYVQVDRDGSVLPHLPPVW